MLHSFRTPWYSASFWFAQWLAYAICGRGSILSRGGDFSLRYSFQAGCVVHTASYPVPTGSFRSRGMMPVTNLHLESRLNVCTTVFIPPQASFLVRCLIRSMNFKFACSNRVAPFIFLFLFSYNFYVDPPPRTTLISTPMKSPSPQPPAW